MARLDELAEGIAEVLRVSSMPEPLPVDLMNQSPAAATFFVRAVVDECARRAAPLFRVDICPILGENLLRQHGASDGGYEGVGIVAIESLENQIEFYRFSTSSADWTKTD